MTKFEDFIQQKLVPVAGRLGSNRFLIAIRDGITYAMPLILIGSFLMVIASLPIPGWEAWLGEIGVSTYLWKGVDSSFNLIALVAAFGISYSLAKQYKADGISAGIINISAFLTVTPFTVSFVNESGKALGEVAGIAPSYLSSGGLFVAIVLGLVNGYAYQWFMKKDIRIKMPEGVPPAVSKSFSAIIPGAVIIVFWLAVYAFLDHFSLPNVHDIVKSVLGVPFGLLGSTLFGNFIVVLLNGFLWFCGVHGGNVLNNPIMKPIWLSNLTENMAAHKAGQELPHVFTSVFMDNFVFIGGAGATIGLVLALAWLARRRKASQQAKVLSPLTLIPGFFNINEPTMFGLPVVLNLLTVIPFVLAPVMNLFVAYFAFASGIVPGTYADPGWTIPPVISGFLATGSWQASVLQLVLIILDILLYLPFIINVERRWQASEQTKNEG
ncbi:TPA: PTS sugar transporter subunit IIC [Streptococcus equi subsp. equi]|nr:PTS sugar transporter subunit IIC [Streptococcus equi subsp. equi]HEK9528889.1 PTS sugar transporter subunit IIC [Streptococcus equi subsp. equi]HEK9532745.1 PTS sugar transporter subunit IIC [Streptococcus equi subsp. equi]